MKKRILSFLLAALIAVSVLPFGALAEGVELVIETPDKIPAVGESFTVTVSVKNNPGLNAVQFALKYNQSEFECEDVSLGNVLNGSLSASNVNDDGLPIIAAAKLEPMTGDGVLMTAEFKVKKTITAWNFSLASDMLKNDSGKLSYTVTVKDNSGLGNNSGNSGNGGSASDTGKTETTPAETASFTDISSHWAKTYIEQATEKGLFSGYPDGTFKPDQVVSRAQFVTVLYRMAGSPEVTVSVPFTDTTDQIPEFQKAIAWAYSNGYANGKSATAFDPTGTLTRQEAMAILFRYSGGTSGAEIMFTSVYDGNYTDSGTVASWAKSAMYWGVYNTLISGTSATTLSPTSTATRGQLAKIMVLYSEKIPASN